MAKKLPSLAGLSGLSRALKVKKMKVKQSKGSSRASNPSKPRRRKNNETAFHIFNEEEDTTGTTIDATKDEQRTAKNIVKRERTQEVIDLTMSGHEDDDDQDRAVTIPKLSTPVIKKGTNADVDSDIENIEDDVGDIEDYVGDIEDYVAETENKSAEDWIDIKNYVSSEDDSNETDIAQSGTGNKPWRPEEIDVVDRCISSLTKMKPALTIAMEVEELLREGSDTPQHGGRAVSGIQKKLGEYGFGQSKLTAKEDVDMFKQLCRQGIAECKQETIRQDDVAHVRTPWTLDELNVLDEYISGMERMKRISDASKDLAKILRSRINRPFHEARSVGAIEVKLQLFKYSS